MKNRAQLFTQDVCNRKKGVNQPNSSLGYSTPTISRQMERWN